MKTLAAAALDILARNNIAAPVYRVYHKRRYFDELTASYLWETSWAELAPNRKNGLISCSPIVWQLDTDQLNEFKVSNVTITVDNARNYWRQGNRAGFFGPTLARPRGYEPYWTKFQVRAAIRLDDGTVTELAIFTGVAVELLSESETGQVQIQVNGLEALLLNADAERIATTVTEEDKGLGDSSNLVFVTTNPGVGRVTEVSLNGIAKVEGVDFTVSNTNSTTLGATVTFTVAPTGAERVRISYFYWPQNQQFHDVVKALLTVGGIASIDQLVDAVVFPNAVLNTVNYSSQGEWDTGTKTLIDTSTAPGSIRADWANLFTARNWSTSLSGWTEEGGGSDWTTDGTYLNKTTFNNTRLYRPSTAIVGSWELKFTLGNTSSDFTMRFTGTSGFTAVSAVKIAADFGDSIALQINGVSVSYVSYTRDTGEHTLKVIRTGSGRHLVYLDSVLKIDYTDTTVTASDNFELITNANAGTTSKFRDIKTPDTSYSPNWRSPTTDAGAAPSAWGIFSYTAIGTGIVYYTDTSADDLTYDGISAISGGDIPTSTLRRYIKAQVNFTVNTTQLNEPNVDQIILRFTTSSTLILLPNLAGDSVYSAIQKLATFANYEFGFSPDETFFFRSKAAGATPVLAIDETDYVASVSGLANGYDRVYSSARATYGAYVKEAGDGGGSAGGPLTRFSRKRLDIDADSSIQIAATADIATGIAALYYARYSQPHRRFKIRTKFLPHVDLSDTLAVTFRNRLPAREWMSGEPGALSGDKDMPTYGDEEQLLSAVSSKVLGARVDVESGACEFDMEEN